jgi:hypothetical protein
MAEVGRLRLSPPSPERETYEARAFGGQLEAPRGGHSEACDLADDRAEPAMPQAFLHAGEHRLVVAGLDVDHPVRRQARLGEGRREEIG